MPDAVCLAADELRQLTGGYSQPAAQLRELHALGFWRARRSRITGRVILERAHYEAVCAGTDAQPKRRAPQLQPG